MGNTIENNIHKKNNIWKHATRYTIITITITRSKQVLRIKDTSTMYIHLLFCTAKQSAPIVTHRIHIQLPFRKSVHTTRYSSNPTHVDISHITLWKVWLFNSQPYWSYVHDANLILFTLIYHSYSWSYGLCHFIQSEINSQTLFARSTSITGSKSTHVYRVDSLILKVYKYMSINRSNRSTSLVVL